MGVSFKVSKVGKRYKPKEPLQSDDIESGNDAQQIFNEGKLEKDDISNYTKKMAASTLQQVPEELEVSFSLNLFLDGFCVRKPKDVLNNVPLQLLPYDRASEAFFTAIEYGRLPGDIFDEIPCKYVNGAVLCEIKDYRRADMATAAISPTIHKVLLQMCMESVVKDISSTSDKSWTYEVLLEVESRILKALQPHLQLNPQLLMNRSSGELPHKKINLGMNWKKRKLNDTLECNSQHLINLQSIGGTQISKSQTGLANHGREIQVSQNDISRAVHSLQVDSEGLEKAQPVPLTLKHNYQLSHGCQTSATVDFSSSLTNSSRRGRESFTLVPSETTRFQAQTIEGLVLKKPKQEPGEFLLQQLPGDEAKIAGAPELSSKNNTLYQQVEAGKVLHERFSHQRGLCSFNIKSGQEVPQGNPKLHHKMSSSTVKQEPAGTTKLSGSYLRKMKDKSLTIDMSSAPNIENERSQQSQSPFKANCHPANTVEKVLRNDKITQKRKSSCKPPVTAGIKNAARSFNGNSLVIEAPLQAKQQNNIPRLSSAKMTDALASTSYVRTADGRSTLGTAHRSWVSNIEGNFHLQQRFEKIGRVTKRYKLNDKKQKSGPLLQRKPFRGTPLASLHLANFVNNAISYRSTSMSECSISQELNISKTRTLTFVHQSYVCQRNENSQIDLDHGNQIKLVISEMVNEGKVEASIIYGVEETSYTSLTFPSNSFADLFVAQFQSLVVNEGYCIAEDLIEPTACDSFGNELSSPCQTIDGSTSRSPAVMTGSISTPLDPRQLSSRRRLLPSANLQILPSNLSQFQLDNAVQVAPAHLQQSSIWMKRANLQFQMMERQRLQAQLVQKMKMEDGLGMTQLSGGFQGLGNAYTALAASYMDVLQIGNSDMVNTASPQIGNINMGQLNNPGSNWNPQNQQFQFGVNFYQSTSLPARQGEVMNGFWTQNCNPQVQMRRSSFADMDYQMNNQQLSQQFENAHFPLSQLNSQHFDQLS